MGVWEISYFTQPHLMHPSFLNALLPAGTALILVYHCSFLHQRVVNMSFRFISVEILSASLFPNLCLCCWLFLLFQEIMLVPVVFKCYSSGSSYNGILKNTNLSLFCDICSFITGLLSSSCARETTKQK